MTEREKTIIRELLDALAMIANGLSTDTSHYQRLDRAIDKAEKMLRRG